MSTHHKNADIGLDTENLPIKLVFVAGEMEIAFGDLARIVPGYIFDLRQSADRHVEIRANGSTIGSGELVEVDGRVGVRILTCT